MDNQTRQPQIKPTLGIIPKKLWDEQRKNELVRAINDRLIAGQEVPIEWVSEYNSLAICFSTKNFLNKD